MALPKNTIWAGIGLVGVGLASMMWVGSARWNRKTSQLVERLFRTLPADKQASVDFSELERLPVPVARYLRATLKEGQPIIRWARIRQAGEFRAHGKDGEWSRFEATQYFLAQRPGFVWDADLRMNPLTRVRVRDAYIAGDGSMQAKMFSLVPLVDAHGEKELAAAALQRYLAEAVWFPTALLPSAGVQWRGIDNSRALATLTDSDITVSLEFHFSESAEITGVSTPGRYREVNGRYELTPWRGHYRHYQETHGMRIPVEAEVAWQLQGESVPYFRGRIVELIYDFVW